MSTARGADMALAGSVSQQRAAAGEFAQDVTSKVDRLDDVRLVSTIVCPTATQSADEC